MNPIAEAEAKWPGMAIYRQGEPLAYDNTNRGVLFKNERKTTDTQPGYTGSLNVDGVEYFLDAWVNEKDGKKYFSVKVKRKEKQQSSRRDDPDAPPF